MRCSILYYIIIYYISVARGTASTGPHLGGLPSPRAPVLIWVGTYELARPVLAGCWSMTGAKNHSECYSRMGGVAVTVDLPTSAIDPESERINKSSFRPPDRPCPSLPTWKALVKVVETPGLQTRFPAHWPYREYIQKPLGRLLTELTKEVSGNWGANPTPTIVLNYLTQQVKNFYKSYPIKVLLVSANRNI